MINVIALEKGRYYIGKHSISNILDGLGPTWVKTYKPVKLIKQISESYEYDTLLEYMEKYGIDYVRGYIYISMELSEYDKNIINKLLFGPKEISTEVICIYCNQIGHNEHSCDKLKYHKENDNKFQQISYKGQSQSKEKSDAINTVSYQCRYCEMNFDNPDIVAKHEYNCKDEAFIMPSGKGLNCERCGRNTHSTVNCRAKSDIYGYDI